MKKTLISAAILAVLTIVAVLAFESRALMTGSGGFASLGYITDRDPSKANEELYLVYGTPENPALDAHLVFSEKSVCRFGEQTIQCVALNATIVRAFGGKRVFVEGKKLGDAVYVSSVSLDLEADRRFGLIRAVSKTKAGYTLSIDAVEILSGDAAVAAALEDTKCPKKEIEDCAPSLASGFYIRNEATSTEDYLLPLSADVAIFENPGSPALAAASADEFAKAFKDPESFMKSYPWKFVLDGATIQTLQEVYMP